MRVEGVSVFTSKREAEDHRLTLSILYSAWTLVVNETAHGFWCVCAPSRANGRYVLAPVTDSLVPLVGRKIW